MRSAVSLALAGYVSSVLESQSLVTKIIRSDSHPAHLSDSITVNAEAADCPDWVSTMAIKVPIHQYPLTR